MLVEFSIIPVGAGEHLSKPIAEVLKIIERSGLSYKLTPGSTCLEGDWTNVMEVIRQCHVRMCEESGHVVSILKIEDEAGVTNKMTSNIQSVEQQIGHDLST
jgi:uncharacterized protein (TIGR00106 family)